MDSRLCHHSIPLCVSVAIWYVTVSPALLQVRNMIVGRRGTSVCLSLRRLIHDPRSGDTLSPVFDVNIGACASRRLVVERALAARAAPAHVRARVRISTIQRSLIIRPCLPAVREPPRNMVKHGSVPGPEGGPDNLSASPMRQPGAGGSLPSATDSI